MVESRKEKDAVKNPEKGREEEDKAERERKLALRCVTQDDALRKLEEK